MINSAQILGECAFQFGMSAGLIRSVKGLAKGMSWENAIFKKTYLPFVGILMVAFVFGFIAQNLFPTAKTILDICTAMHSGN